MRIIKPFFIAVLILAALFTAGFMNGQTIGRLSDDMDEQLRLSQTAAEEGRWEDAAKAFSAAKDTWKSHEAYFHVVIDHKEIDEMESLFSEAGSYARQQDSNRYCTSSGCLSVRLNHMKEAQQMNWKNIF